MNKNEQSFMGCFGMIVAFGITIVIASLMNGWALSLLWEWFVVSAFEVPSLSLVQSIGISMIAAYLTYHRQSGQESEDSILERVVETLFFAIVHSLLTVATGWIVLQFL